MNDPSRMAELFTDHRTVFVTVKNIRPMFTRVPIGDGKGLDPRERIALDVDSVNVKGAFGDDPWGRPKDVETVEDIQSWSKGLSDPHGGGGNILKLRKQQQADSSNPPKPLAEQTTLVQLSARQGPVIPAMPPVHMNAKKQHIRRWKVIAENLTHHLPDDEIYRTVKTTPFSRGEADQPITEAGHTDFHREADSPKLPHRKVLHALDITSSPPASPRSNWDGEPSPPATPSHWSPSIRGSQRHSSPEVDNDEIELPSHNKAYDDNLRSRSNSAMLVDVKQEENLRGPSPIQNAGRSSVPPSPMSSVPAAPTPAQGPKPPPPTASDQLMDRETPNRIKDVPSTFGSMYPPTSPFSPMSREQGTPPRQDIKTNLGDRSFHPYLSGPGRILVPNSDSSGTASQPQGRSQSLPAVFSSQNQPLSQVRTSQSLPNILDSQSLIVQDSQSQPQGRSQLRNEIMPSSDQVEPPASSRIDVKEPATPSPVDYIPSTPAHAPPVSQVSVIETWPSSEIRRNNRRPPTSPIEPADSPFKTQKLTGNESKRETGDADDVEARVAAEYALNDEDKSAEADDEAASNASTDDPDSHALEEEPEYVDDVEVDQLDSDDEITDVMVRQSEVAVLAEDLEQPVKRAVDGDKSDDIIPHDVPMLSSSRASSVKSTTKQTKSVSRTYSSDLPAMPSSPDVFLSEASFRQESQLHSNPRSVSERRSQKSSQTPPVSSEEPVRGLPEQTAQIPSPTVTQMNKTVQISQNQDFTQISAAHHEKSVAPVPTTPMAGPSTGNHDVDAWRAPSFMRQQEQGKVDARPGTSVPVVTRKAKRPISVISVSSSSERDEPPPAKKRKVAPQQVIEIESSPEPSPPRILAPPAGRADAKGKGKDVLKADLVKHSTPRLPHIDLRRSASILSTRSRGSKKRTSDRSVESTLKPNASSASMADVSRPTSSASPVREIDFRVLSRTSSTSARDSSRNPREPGDSGPRMTEPVNVEPVLSSRPPSTKESNASQSPENALKTSSRSRKGKEVDRGGGGSPFASSSAIPTASTGEGKSRDVRGKGFKIDADVRQVNGLPPVTWGVLKDILLRTGRARFKQQQKQKKGDPGP
ncbi:unnamed protein product [Somion occarium]